MSKYQPITGWLRRDGRLRVRATFDEISALVEGLPKSASVHNAWWLGDPDASPTHVQKRAWGDAGYVVEGVDRAAGRVVFVREP